MITLKKNKFFNIKIIVIFLIILSVFAITEIQPFSREVLSNTSVSDKTILYLEEDSTETVNEDTPLGETKTPTSESTGPTTNSVVENEPVEEISHPIKIGTVSVVGGDAINTGSIGK